MRASKIGALACAGVMALVCGCGGVNGPGGGGASTTSSTTATGDGGAATTTGSDTTTTTSSTTTTPTSSTTTTPTGSGGSGGTTTGCPGCDGPPIFGALYGEDDVEGGHALTTDGAGAIYLSGVYYGDLDFGLGPLPAVMPSPTISGNRFLVKLDPAGQPIWQKGYESGYARSLTIDKDGNLLVVGTVSSGTDLGGGPVTLPTDKGIFVTKLDPSGAHLWSRAFATVIGLDLRDWAVATGPAAEVVIVATLKAAVDMGGGTLPPLGKRDVIVAKLDASGNHVWSKRFGGPGEEVGVGVGVDAQGGVLLTGHGAGIDLGGGPVGPGGTMFLAKLDGAGNHVWSKAMGGPGPVEPTGFAIDAAGDLAVVGFAPDGFDLGGGPRQAPPADSACFVAKLSPAGAHLWSRAFGCYRDIAPAGPRVAMDPAGAVAVSASLTGTADFGFGPRSSLDRDAIVYRLDANGAPLWARIVGSQGLDGGFAVAADAGGNVISTGFVQYDVDLGAGLLHAHGDNDIFLVKYAP